jgi:hypothetical protein
MAQLNIAPPSLPLAPEQYQRYYQDQLNSILRLFFNQMTNPGDMGGTSLNLNLETLPTDADYINLRLGDVYRDTQGGTLQTGTNLLRIKVPIKPIGVSASGAVGSVSPVGGTITRSLTGVSSTGAVGTVTP